MTFEITTAAVEVATAGAATPFLVGLGAAAGQDKVGYGIYKANTAKTDGEAKQAFETMGNGTFALGASVLAAGKSLETASKVGVEIADEISSNPLKNLATCIKSTPESLKQSTKFLTGNIGGVSTADGVVLSDSNKLSGLIDDTNNERLFVILAEDISGEDAGKYPDLFKEFSSNIELNPEHNYQYCGVHGAMQLYDDTAGEEVITLVRQLSNPTEYMSAKQNISNFALGGLNGYNIEKSLEEK